MANKTNHFNALKLPDDFFMALPELHYQPGPADCFSPEGALSGKPFEKRSLPYCVPQKKTLVVLPSSLELNHATKNNTSHLLLWLKDYGFDLVYFYQKHTGKAEIQSIDFDAYLDAYKARDLPLNLGCWLKKTGFSEPIDQAGLYAVLASSLHLERDAVCVLTPELLGDVNQSVNQKVYHNGMVYSAIEVLLPRWSIKALTDKAIASCVGENLTSSIVSGTLPDVAFVKSVVQDPGSSIDALCKACQLLTKSAKKDLLNTPDAQRLIAESIKAQARNSSNASGNSNLKAIFKLYDESSDWMYWWGQYAPQLCYYDRDAIALWASIGKHSETFLSEVIPRIRIVVKQDQIDLFFELLCRSEQVSDAVFYALLASDFQITCFLEALELFKSGFTKQQGEKFLEKYKDIILSNSFNGNDLGRFAPSILASRIFSDDFKRNFLEIHAQDLDKNLYVFYYFHLYPNRNFSLNREIEHAVGYLCDFFDSTHKNIIKKDCFASNMFSNAVYLKMASSLIARMEKSYKANHSVIFAWLLCSVSVSELNSSEWKKLIRSHHSLSEKYYKKRYKNTNIQFGEYLNWQFTAMIYSMILGCKYDHYCYRASVFVGRDDALISQNDNFHLILNTLPSEITKNPVYAQQTILWMKSKNNPKIKYLMLDNIVRSYRFSSPTRSGSSDGFPQAYINYFFHDIQLNKYFKQHWLEGVKRDQPEYFDSWSERSQWQYVQGLVGWDQKKKFLYEKLSIMPWSIICDLLKTAPNDFFKSTGIVDIFRSAKLDHQIELIELFSKDFSPEAWRGISKYAKDVDIAIHAMVKSSSIKTQYTSHHDHESAITGIMWVDELMITDLGFTGRYQGMYGAKSSTLPQDTSCIQSISLWADDSTIVDQLLADLDHGKYPSLKRVTIAGGDPHVILSLVNILGEKFSQGLLKLIEVIVPQIESIVDGCKNVNLPIQFFLLSSDRFDVNLQSGRLPIIHHVGFDENLYDEKLPNKCYVYRKFNNHTTTVQKKLFKKKSYDLVEIGRLLNPVNGPVQSVRTAMSRFDISETDIAAVPLYPDASLATWVELHELSHSEFQSFCQSHEPGVCYYQFSVNLPENQTVILPGIDAQEEMMGVCTSSSLNLAALSCWHERFYCMKSKINQSISYVVKAPTAQVQAGLYDQVPAWHPIRVCLDNFRQRNNYSRISDLSQMIEKQSGQSTPDWLDEIYHCGHGACAQRVAAIIHQLVKSDVKTNEYHVVVLNHSHVRVEFKYNNTWIQCETGGSIENKIIHENEFGIDLMVVPDFMEIDRVIQDEVASLDCASDSQPEQDEVIEETMLSNESHVNDLKALLYGLTEARQVDGMESLLASWLDVSPDKALIVTENTEAAVQCFLKSFKQSPRLVYVLDGESSLRMDHEHLVLDNACGVNVDSLGPLKPFFKEAELLETQDRVRPVLMVQWDAFSASKRVLMQALLDVDPMLQGLPLPKSIQVISFVNKMPDDLSFLSRHTRSYQVSVKPKISLGVVSCDTKKIICDLQGFPDWQSKLMGRVVLQNQKMVWHSTELANHLLRCDPLSVTISHLPDDLPGVRSDCERWLGRAISQGYLVYKDLEIPLHENTCFSIDESAFRFDDFIEFSISSDVSYECMHPQCLLMNTHLLDLLLYGRVVDGVGAYCETPGWIENAKSNKKLYLYITSILTDSQWYWMLSWAKKCQVFLAIQLAPGVDFPPPLGCIHQFEDHAGHDEIRSSYEIEPRSNQAHDAAHVKVVVCNALANVDFQDYLEGADSRRVLVIDMEDQSWPDLVGNLTFDQDGCCFKSFNYHASDLIRVLKAEHSEFNTVLFKGRFSDAMRMYLQPWSVGQAVPLPDGTPFKPMVDLIIIDEIPDALEGNHPWLFLGSKVRCVAEPSSSDVNDREVVYRESHPFSDGDVLENSIIKTQAFYKNRYDAVLGALKKNPIIQIEGPSGVGKSRFMVELNEHRQVYDPNAMPLKIHYGLEALNGWATDECSGMNILFVDESNIECKHLTFFVGLADPDNPIIYYQGTAYTLSDNHKVVLAGNPVAYGGGRHEQLLHTRLTVPKLLFSDFPPAVLYERIVKPCLVFHHAVESSLKALALPHIEKHLKSCREIGYAANDDDMQALDAVRPTVRELQHDVMMACAKVIDSKTFSHATSDGSAVSSGSDQFVICDSHRDVHCQLRDWIVLHLMQHNRQLTSHGFGLNGFIIEGSSGVGKSEAVKYQLLNSGYKALKTETLLQIDNRDPDFASQPYWLKLDAGLPLETITKALCTAFEFGMLVWIDEADAIITQAGFESILNDILTGYYPGRKRCPTQPGFGVIMTGNGITQEGRRALSSAMQHRCVQVSMVMPSRESLALMIHGQCVTAFDALNSPSENLDKGQASKQLANDFSAVVLSEPGVNLRSFSLIKSHAPRLYNDERLEDIEVDLGIKTVKDETEAKKNEVANQIDIEGVSSAQHILGKLGVNILADSISKDSCDWNERQLSDEQDLRQKNRIALWPILGLGLLMGLVSAVGVWFAWPWLLTMLTAMPGLNVLGLGVALTKNYLVGSLGLGIASIGFLNAYVRCELPVSGRILSLMAFTLLVSPLLVGIASVVWPAVIGDLVLGVSTQMGAQVLAAIGFVAAVMGLHQCLALLVRRFCSGKQLGTSFERTMVFCGVLLSLLLLSGIGSSVVGAILGAGASIGLASLAGLKGVALLVAFGVLMSTVISLTVSVVATFACRGHQDPILSDLSAMHHGNEQAIPNACPNRPDNDQSHQMCEQSTGEFELKANPPPEQRRNGIVPNKGT